MKRIYDLLQSIKIPIRNVWRNRRRTLLTIAGIMVASICLMLAGGYIRIMEIGLTDTAISKEFGHFQIARTGYFDEDNTSFGHLIPEEEFLMLETMLKGLEAVDYVNLRLHLVGIIGNVKGSTVFAGTCGVPEAENRMKPTVSQGRPMSADDPTGIVIGSGMADKLNVEVGENLLLFFSSDSGSQEAINVNVRGVFNGLLKEQENIMIQVPIEAAWDLMLERKAHRMLVF